MCDIFIAFEYSCAKFEKNLETMYITVCLQIKHLSSPGQILDKFGDSGWTKNRMNGQHVYWVYKPFYSLDYHLWV